MEMERGQINDGALSIASTQTWNTFLSRTSVSSLSSAAFSNPHLTGRANGLDEVLNTVKTLSLRRIPYEEIERQDVVGEGETFVVERCVVRNQILAIKHLKTNLSPDDSVFRRRIQSVILELRIMRHAPLRSHPNILTVFGYGWNMGASRIAPYLLVQYAPYGTLRQYLQHTKPETSITQKEILIGDVAAATSALHLCGIIHGDIKLDNVLIFHSWDRPSKSIAKISDFGHSLIVTGNEDTEQYLKYGGTFIYNAPEVHNQKVCPIDRSALKKCDIWAFGLLTWEVFLDGDEYTNYVAKIEEQYVNSRDEVAVTIPHRFKDLAKESIPFSKRDLYGSIIRSAFNLTLQVDPTKRTSNLDRLPFLSKWHAVGVQGLQADLALHFGNSEWSYEMLRPENGREIPWEHEVHIYQGLRRTYNSSENRNGDAAWQLALCQYLGFGDSPALRSAHQLALAAERLGHPAAKVFAPLLEPQGPPESYFTEKTYSNRIVELLQQNKAVVEQSELAAACCKGDTETIFTWLMTPTESDEAAEEKCNILRFLFALEDSPQQPTIVKLLGWDGDRLPIDLPTKKVYTVHNQYPLRLSGSPLVFAISVNSADTVHQLLSLGADPCARAFAPDQFPEVDHRSKWTPIHVAVQYHCPEILSDLLRIALAQGYKNEVPYGCALSYSSCLERVAMHGKTHQKSLQETVFILKEFDDLLAATPNGMTPFMQAIDFQDTDVISALCSVQKGIENVPFQDPRNSTNFTHPIHFAAQLGCRRDIPEAVETIKTIAENMSFDKPLCDNFGRTPLHLAVTGPSKRAAGWLLDKSPSLLNIEDQFGMTALHYCTSAANTNLLLSKGADVNYTNKYGITPLHWACYRGNIDIVRCLLERKPLLNLKNNSYGTPLHCAIIRGSLDVTIALLEAGASVNEVNQLGTAPLHLASALCRHNIIRHLIQNGADLHMVDAKGMDAATIAKKLGTMAGIVASEILENNTTTSLEALYARRLDTDFEDTVLPSYQRTITTTTTTTTTATVSSSETIAHDSDTVLGGFELPEYSELFDVNAEQDQFDESEPDPEPQGPKRRLAEFIYTLTAEYLCSITDARYVSSKLPSIMRIANDVDFEKLSAYIDSEEDGANSIQTWDSFTEVTGCTRQAMLSRLVRSLNLVRLLREEIEFPEESLTKLHNAAKIDDIPEGDFQWYARYHCMAVALELARPIWDLWELDDAKVEMLRAIAKVANRVEGYSQYWPTFIAPLDRPNPFKGKSKDEVQEIFNQQPRISSPTPSDDSLGDTAGDTAEDTPDDVSEGVSEASSSKAED
ncbi:hypothetical protein Daesc_008581 [Daldinia eschscholtzii]|uniref:Protein kinase domain-containing protein n=1 Tax=Daldinia eschscholtzii TaxID=292717 RepID=A0AAX6MC87_9PEZI